MLTVTGEVRAKKIREYTKKDGTQGVVHELTILGEDDLYPTVVTVDEKTFSDCSEHEDVELPVKIFVVKGDNAFAKFSLKV